MTAHITQDSSRLGSDWSPGGDVEARIIQSTPAMDSRRDTSPSRQMRSVGTGYTTRFLSCKTLVTKRSMRLSIPIKPRGDTEKHSEKMVRDKPLGMVDDIAPDTVQISTLWRITATSMCAGASEYKVCQAQAERGRRGVAAVINLGTTMAFLAFHLLR